MQKFLFCYTKSSICVKRKKREMVLPRPAVFSDAGLLHYGEVRSENGAVRSGGRGACQKCALPGAWKKVYSHERGGCPAIP